MIKLLTVVAIVLLSCTPEIKENKMEWIKAPEQIPQDSGATPYLVYYVKTGYDVNSDSLHYSVSRKQIDILVWWPEQGWDVGHITRQTKFTEVTVLYWMPLPEPPEE